MVHLVVIPFLALAAITAGHPAQSEKSTLEPCPSVPQPVVESGCFLHNITNTNDCPDYYVECPNATTKPCFTGRSRLMAGCVWITYKGADGCQHSVQSCTVSNPPTQLDIARQCRKQPETGPCKAYFKKWYYSAGLQKCIEFVYGGCGGNNNRFDSEAECLERCAGVHGCAIPDFASRDGCSMHTYTTSNGCESYYMDCRNATIGPCPSSTGCPSPKGGEV